jgi:hypothetical protein
MRVLWISPDCLMHSNNDPKYPHYSEGIHLLRFFQTQGVEIVVPCQSSLQYHELSELIDVAMLPDVNTTHFDIVVLDYCAPYEGFGSEPRRVRL